VARPAPRHQANPSGPDVAHARHHYGISTEFYRLFLGDQMQYSCAYFRDQERESPEQAQRNKLIHTAVSARDRLAKKAGS
jgi:cyclopropane-fatty-acyl-phospholipid synthase